MISTNVKHLEDLTKNDYSDFDEFYLGDSTCFNNKSLSSDLNDLEKAVNILHEQNKKIYVSVVELPLNDQNKKVEKFIESILHLPIDGIEASHLGMIKKIRSMSRNDLEIHAGRFSNIYTYENANIYKETGVNRIFGNIELSLDNSLFIKKQTEIDVTFQIHGKLMLTPLVACIFKSVDKNYSCNQHIENKNRTIELETERWPEKHRLLCQGKSMYSAKDVCLIESLDYLVSNGIKNFFINTNNESRGNIKKVVSIYKDSLNKILSSTFDENPLSEIEELKMLSKDGLCNGYLFSESGYKYISKVLC